MPRSSYMSGGVCELLEAVSLLLPWSFRGINFQVVEIRIVEKVQEGEDDDQVYIEKEKCFFCAFVRSTITSNTARFGGPDMFVMGNCSRSSFF